MSWPDPRSVIENPILNSPFEEPARHFRFDDDGITDEIVEGRRPVVYFVPIPSPKKKGKQLVFDTEWTEDRIEENEHDQPHPRAGRAAGGSGLARRHPATRALLDHWTDPERERRLFFCQIEALETVIYLTEVAKKHRRRLDRERAARSAEDANPGLFRVALKMATGTGKTVVMAMLIAWQALNKARQPAGQPVHRRLPRRHARHHDPRPAPRPAAVRPGQLLPGARPRPARPDAASSAGRRSSSPTSTPSSSARRARRRKLTKELARPAARRVHRDARRDGEPRLPRAGHASGRSSSSTTRPTTATAAARRRRRREKLTGEERARGRASANEEARLWITGLEAVTRQDRRQGRLRPVRHAVLPEGLGLPEGTLFPWVVSDFSLIDAIEAGIVKIPRVPVADNAMTGDQPTYRDLWVRIRDDLPKKGRKTEAVDGRAAAARPSSKGRCRASTATTRSRYRRVGADAERQADGTTPPVFIVVCNNTNVSKLVFDYIAGCEKTAPRRRDGRRARQARRCSAT